MSVSRMLALSFALCAVLCFGAAPAPAGEYVYFGGSCYWYVNAPDCFRDAQRAIYHRQNLIAHLEANPDVDDGYKSVVIPSARAEVHRLRAMTGVRHRLWPTPCCYSRQPIYIR